MQIQLIRSATLRLDYVGQCMLIDPYLAAKHTGKSYAGQRRSPLVELPGAPEEVIAGIDAVLISHLHSDHFDAVAESLLPRGVPILCQPEDQADLRTKGFRNVIPIEDTLIRDEIAIMRTPCQHGTGEVLVEMGVASGFVLRAEGEPTVYWAGDTVWCQDLADVIARVQPDVIVTHSCGAVWGDDSLILMDAQQTVAVCRAAPTSTVVATHMEAVDHATVTRAALRSYAEAHGIGRERLRIPEDGEILAF